VGARVRLACAELARLASETNVDVSSAMLALAREKLAAAGAEVAARGRLVRGDLRAFDVASASAWRCQDVFGELPSGAGTVARTETMVSTDLATRARVIRSA